MIATEGHLGYGLIQRQTITELMTDWLGMGARILVWARMHLHAWVCRESRGACLWSLPVQWSCEVSERWQQFTTDSREIGEIWSPFQNKAPKIIENPLNMGPERFLAWMILTSTEVQIRFQHLSIHGIDTFYLSASYSCINHYFLISSGLPLIHLLTFFSITP